MRLRKTFFRLVGTITMMQMDTTSAQTKILALGDSMTEFMGETLESICGNSKVYNAGVGGTTATQWASYSKDEIAACGSDWDVVYISVGGNDLLESGCTMESSELKNRMEAAISNIVQNIAPEAATYVLTGYCIPSAAEDDLKDSDCNSPSNYEALAIAIRDISADNVGLSPNSSLVVVDSSTVCGGSTNSFSNGDYFQDPIHLNTKGYCLVFSQPSVQSALQCTQGSEGNCNELLGDEFIGLENNCFGGGGSSGDDSSGDGDEEEDDNSGNRLTFIKTALMLTVFSVVMM